MKLYRMPLHIPFANLSEQNLIRLSSEDLPYAIIENKQDMRFIYPPACDMALLWSCSSPAAPPTAKFLTMFSKGRR